MNVWVTIGAGFIGSLLVGRLVMPTSCICTGYRASCYPSPISVASESLSSGLYTICETLAARSTTPRIIAG